MLIIGKALRNAEFDIEWVGALSMEEYEAGKEYIPSIEACWWLRSPGVYSYNATYVYTSGGVGACGNYVSYGILAVRPTLRIGNLKFVKPGDKVEIVGLTWTVISENLVLADEIIGHTNFNKDIRQGNEYHGSNLEECILTWWEKRRKA